MAIHLAIASISFPSSSLKQLMYYVLQTNTLLLDALSAGTTTYLPYDVAVIRWITSCHKNRKSTRVITLWRERVTILTTSVSTMHFRIEIMFILKAIKSHFKGSYDKQNLTHVVISYEIYETHRRLVS